MYVQKDLTLAPLLEQVDEDAPQLTPDGGEAEGIIVGGGDNSKIQDRIDKTFYGRIQLTSQTDDYDGPIVEEDFRPLKAEPKATPKHHAQEKKQRQRVSRKVSEKFDPQEGRMRDSMATQIDFPDVRIELGELTQLENDGEENGDKDSYADDKDFEVERPDEVVK